MALDPLKFKIAIDKASLSTELEDAKKLLKKGLSDIPVTLKIANLAELEKLLKNIGAKLGSSGGGSGSGSASKELEKETKSFEELRKSAEAAKKTLADITPLRNYMKNIEAIDVAIDKLCKTLRGLEKSKTALSSIGGNTSSNDALIAEVKNRIRMLEELKKNEKLLFKPHALTSPQSLGSVAAIWKNMSAFMSGNSEFIRNSDRVVKAMEKISAMSARLSTLSNLATSKGWSNVSGDALRKASEWMSKARGTDVNDASAVRALMREYQKLALAISEARKEQGKINNAGMRDAAKEARELERAHRGASQSTRQLTADEQALANAIQRATSEAQRQSQILTDLKSMAMQYLSVYAGQQFLNNIIEIGGQLEMQRLSIGAILQDTAHANDLFDKIKSLALQSPFGVVELDQFTKQLSAYGFQYNELYDMTKRLADISAGAGTDVSRLALALGHVRSEGALTGYTLRQFAMNNIPMLGKLSEKLSELEGRIVTAGEVRKRVSKKEIDYSMVESVIKDLTNEGGMFYNMQEVISGSVKAKWKNLRDAFDVMYGEMAESAVGSALKGTAALLTALAKRWKELGTVILSVVAVYGGFKTYMMICNALLGQQTVATLRSIAADKQATMTKLRLAQSYRQLTLAERLTLAAGNRIRVSDLQTAISTKGLTTESLAKAVAMGKVSKATALAAVANSTLEKTERQLMYTTIQNTRVLGLWGKAAYAARVAWGGIVSVFRTIVNPMTVTMAAISAMIYLWQRNNQEMERASEISKSLTNRADEGIRNANTMMRETGMTYVAGGKPVAFGSIAGGKINHAPASSMDSDAMIQTMEKWETYIKDYSSMPNTLLQNALFDEGKLRSVSEQYEHLAAAVESVMNAQLALSQIASGAEFVVNSTNTGNWLERKFNDDIVTNMNDYAKSVRNTDSALLKFTRDHRGAMVAALNTAAADKTFAEALESANATMQEKEKRNLTEIEMLRLLAESQNEYAVAIRQAEQAIGNTGDKEGMKTFGAVLRATRKESGQKDTLLQDMDVAAASLGALVKERWHKDISEINDYEKQALLQLVTDIASKSGEATETIRNKIVELFSEKLGIEIDIKTVDAHMRISEVQEELNKLVAGPDGDGTWTIDIRGVVDANDLVQKVREAYKKAKDTITNLGPIAVKMGLSLNNVKVMSEEEINDASGGSVIRKMALTAINEAYKAIAQAETASNTYGFSLTDPTQGGKVFRDKKGKKGSAGSKEDKEAKEWRERIRVLKDARSWYDKWEKEIGHTSALEKVQEMFKGLVSKSDIETLEAYERALDAVIAKAQARRAKNGGKDERAEEIIRQGEVEKAQIAMMKFKRDSDAFTSGVDKEMETLTRQWEIFNNVLAETGDRILAMRLAGFGSSPAFTARNSAEMLQGHIGMAMEGSGKSIDFSRVMRMTDNEIEKYVKDLIGGSAKYSKNIDGIVKGLKEWRKLNEAVVKRDIENYAKLIGSAQDYWSLIRKNNSEYDETAKMLGANLAMGLITPEGYAKGMGMAAANRDSKNSKLSANYITLMNNANAMTRGEVLDALDNAVMHLEEDMRAGTITFEQYVNEIEKLEGIRSEWDKNGFFGAKGAFGSFIAGGNQGLIGYYQGRATKYRTAAAEARQKYGEDSEEYKNAKTMADKYEKLAKGLEKLTDNAEKIVAVTESLINGLGLVSDMFSALGAKGAGQAVGDVAGILSGAVSGASSLSALGPYGMAAGAALGLVTSVAKKGDEQRQRRIDEIQQDVQKIDNTLNLIRQLRERELGYSNAELRKRLASMYSGSGLRGKQAMEDYYNFGTGGSVYEQELEMLKKQRNDILHQYQLESGKKDASDDALQEYINKISELDQKILFFSEDLAKELWSIDIKGWADQIGDALMNAFENGTSAAEAFKDATRGIMQSVVSEMLKVGFIQPLMQKLQDRLFGENGKFDPTNPQASMGAVLSELGRFFGQGGEGQAMMVAADEFLTGAEELLQKNFHVSLKNSSSSSQTSGIQSQATEESIGIVSGQLARMAQDLSVCRIFQTEMATKQMPTIIERMGVQNAALESQLQSVRAIERMMMDGDGAMYKEIYRMSRKIDKAITPEGRMRVE